MRNSAPSLLPPPHVRMGKIQLALKPIPPAQLPVAIALLLPRVSPVPLAARIGVPWCRHPVMLEHNTSRRRGHFVPELPCAACGLASSPVFCPGEPLFLLPGTAATSFSVQIERCLSYKLNPGYSLRQRSHHPCSELPTASANVHKIQGLPDVCSVSEFEYD
ncbi:hypothetical protein CFC21_024793 [Triticum aestivum]|uniref:Uncharacterized protein n=3 Tax=Triticum TaxID=4564 RepID=A0A9R1RQX2_TRITD|nr:hypothetical protein CFC21_024793 [Triticum aestivum]VAH50313.1 unnamed protein product [Triticum turgidum subsp. durum]